MSSPFLSKEYIALALIKAKFQIFDESFATTSELNQFILFMQQEFNERELGVVITHELGIEDFNVKDGVVTVTDRCCFDLDRLPDEILNILTDESLILNFFTKIETRRLEILKSFQPSAAQSSTNKMLSLVLPKSDGKGISNIKY